MREDTIDRRHLPRTPIYRRTYDISELLASRFSPSFAILDTIIEHGHFLASSFVAARQKHCMQAVADDSRRAGPPGPDGKCPPLAPGLTIGFRSEGGGLMKLDRVDSVIPVAGDREPSPVFFRFNCKNTLAGA